MALGKYSKGGVKMHTVPDLRGSIPDTIYVTDSRWHDSNFLDVYEPVIHLPGYISEKKYPEDLRLVKFYDAEKDEVISFITNNM